jgi:prepilin-type N-terminal cleavage/methylation domain-containing protein
MGTRSSQRGFTLIEAAVAIAVVAILSGIIIPLVVKNLRDSQISRAKNDVQVIAAAIASQIKDTGRRPNLGAGPNMANGGGAAATGAGQALWRSGPAGVVNVAGFGPGAGNSFVNLLTAGTQVAADFAAANALFGAVANDEFSYRGPYIGTDVAVKTDPWGSPYYILGYNATSQGYNGPIWVVCAGPDKGVLAANRTAGATGYPVTWNQTVATGGLSQDDIVVRLN